MDQETLLRRCQSIVNQRTNDTVSDWVPDDAIGFFQTLRPQGDRLTEVFADLVHGNELLNRLREVFRIAGDPTRPDGNRDAYFVVRKPVEIPTARLYELAQAWLDEFSKLDQRIGDGRLADLLDKTPDVRILEGQSPKQPRATDQRCQLLNLINEFSRRYIDPLEPEQNTLLALRPAYYFIACDGFLREHLMWPVYREMVGVNDPFAPYFLLWTAGAKYRIFNDQQIDFYVPRRV